MIGQPLLVPFPQYLEETCHEHAIPVSEPAAAAEPEQQTRDHEEHHSNQ